METQTNLPAVPQGSWGAEADTSAEDLLISRINLQHELSQAVRGGKARPGDFLDSVSNEVLAKPIEFIPVKTFRQWLIVDANDKKKMLGRVMVDKTNEDWEEKGTHNNQPCIRMKTLNFFVLLPNKLDGLPFLISFKKSGMYAGKILSTHFQTCAMRRQTHAGQTFMLGSEQRITNGNQYMAPTVGPGRPTTPEEIAVAYTWFQRLSASEVKVDEADATPF